MKFRCWCGKEYTIPQVDIMIEKKNMCECGQSPNRFELTKLKVIEKEGSFWIPLFL